jgi:hypothetical protein
MLKALDGGRVCLAFVLVFLLCACNSEKKAGTTEGIQEGQPLTSYSEEITSPVTGFEVKAGETYPLEITVKNTGTQAWYGHGRVAQVDASYRWLDSKGTILPIEGNRAVLNPAVLEPGASDQLKLPVVAPPNPGSYILWVSMVQEGVIWFYGKGAKPLALRVTVD